MDVKYVKAVPADERDVMALYEDAGWTAYTCNPEKLMKAVENSASVYSAYSGDMLVGLARTVGDGESITYVQDLLVHSDFRKTGIGTGLMNMVFDDSRGVTKVVLLADRDEGTDAFYESLGFVHAGEAGCRAYLKTKGEFG